VAHYPIFIMSSDIISVHPLWAFVIQPMDCNIGVFY